MVRVQQTEDFAVGLLSAAVLENFNLYANRIFVAETCGELDSAVRGGIVRYESAYETDHNRRRFGRNRMRRDTPNGGRLPCGDCGKNCQPEYSDGDTDSVHVGWEI